MKNGSIIGAGCCVIFATAPFVFVERIHDFANLPQEAFIQACVPALLASGCASAVCRREPLRLYFPPAVPVSGFVLWSVATLFWARNLYEGVQAASHLIACALIFPLLVLFVNSNRWLFRILESLAFSAFGIALVGCLQYFEQLAFIPQAVGPAATFANRNVASQFVCMILPLFPAIYLCSKGIGRKTAILAGFFVCLFYLLVSETRAGWFAFFASYCFEAACLSKVFRNATVWKPLSKKWILAVAVVFSSAAVFMLMHKSVNWRKLGELSIKTLTHEVVATTPTAKKAPVYEDTMEVRLAVWKNSFEMVRRRPFHGFGIGNYNVFYPAYHRSCEQDYVFDENRHLHHAHNDYIQIAVESGVLGLVLFCTSVAWMFYMNFRVFSKNSSAGTRLAVVGIAGGVIAFLVQAFFSFPFQRALPSLLFFVYIAISAIFYARLDRKRRTVSVKIGAAAGVILIGAMSVAAIFVAKYQVDRIAGDYYYRKALEHEKKADWNETILCALNAMEKNPVNRKALSAMGHAYFEIGEFEKSVLCLELFTDSNPYDLSALINLGVAFHRAGNDSKAIGAFERALEVKPDSAKVLSNLGKIHMKKGNLDEALSCFEKASSFDAKDPFFHIDLGVLHFRKGDYREAVASYEKALALDPGLIFAHKAIALICGKYLRNNEKASMHLREYRRLRKMH